MILLSFMIRLSFQQELSLTVADLMNPSSDIVNGWTVSMNGITNPHKTIISKCDQNLLVFNQYPRIYSKTFTITDEEYDQLYLEMDIYFMVFSQSRIKIYINSILVFTQKFSTNYMKQNAICGNSDSYYTIHQKFQSQQTQLNLEIQYTATQANSQLGVKNLNIYTNGYKLSNGCNLDTPFLQGTQCVEYCSLSNAYLGGDDMLVCQSGIAGQSSLIGKYLVSDIVWIYEIQDADGLINTVNLQIDNTYINAKIMYSNLFTSSFQSVTQLYYITQSIQSTHKLQISFVFYILGDWDDGSQVGLYITGDTIYQNNMVRIFKQMGQYSSSTGSAFYYTKIQQNNGNLITVRRTLITYQANFYSSTVKIGFSQQLIGSTAKYGFGNLYIYELLNDPKIVLSGLYGLPYQCIADHYAYNGYCRQTCPPYSFQSQANNNCTDFASIQSKIFINTQPHNYYGIYIVKEFYNNNFNWDNVKNLFQVALYPTYNYLNGQPFSFIGNKKILGGYSSWGWGTYLASLDNLPFFFLHNQIRIYFTLYLIDVWQSGDTFTYYLDENQGQVYSQNNPDLQFQGLNNPDQQLNVVKIIIHTKSTLNLIFQCNIQSQNSMVASCGISDLFVIVDQKIDIICLSITQYFSYFTNNCEDCITPGCQLYPDYQPVPFIKCSIGCLLCSSNSVCSACDLNSGYYKLGDICSCLTGYYFQTTCKKCHYSCKECTGSSSGHCSQCEITRTLQLGVCLCNAGKVDVFSQAQCEPINSTPGYCHYSCATCFSTSYYHCSMCPLGSHRSFLSFNWNPCTCNSQYVDIGVTICSLITCDDSCLTCSGPLESNCLTCTANFRLDSGYCICDGQYNNIIQAQSCVINSPSCHDTCLTCLNPQSSGCLSCDKVLNRYLKINTQTNEQFCTCSDGYFESSSTCQLCDQSCLTCVNSAANCIDCDGNKYREMSNTDTCVCMINFNDKLNPGQACVQNLFDCHYSCSQCYGQLQDQCLVCNSSFRILKNTYCDCLPQQYDYGQLQCQNCDQTCLTCNGIQMNNCLTCNISQHRTLQQNQCICITGYNNKLNINSCEEDLNNCDLTCLICYGIGQDQCLTCQPDRYFKDSFCVCKSNYYEELLICNLCDATCLTCQDSGPNNCTDCDSQNFRQKNNKTCNCQSGYVDIGTPECQVCPNDCNDCDSKLKCITCEIEQSNVNDDGRCDCIDGYLLRDLQCLSCHYSCQKCFGLLNSQCTKCDSQQLRQLTDSACLCIDGYQENDSGQCIDCLSDQGKELFQCKYKNASDGIWTYGEQCDDANNDSRDGCNNYQITTHYSCMNILFQPSICFKCPDNCLKCEQQQDQVICKQCDQNYYNAINACILCKEESCLECPTPSYCQVCMNQQIPILGVCNICKQGYYYQDNNCISKCGDGIKTISEQCDDGNIQSRDGCSEFCQIEDNFVCETINNNSNCFIHEQPYLIYEVPRQQNNEQKRILISVSQNVSYEDIQIELIDQTDIEKQFVLSGNDKLMIDLKLNFNQSYDTNTIIILINGMIVNQYNQVLKDNKIQITLQNIFVQSRQELQTAQQISKVGQGVVIGLFSLSTTTLFMAGISQFISFFNLLQQLQYIQYLNIQFPPHLMQFLNIFNGFRVAPIFEIFSIQQKLTHQDPQQQMFLINGMNAYYLANMSGFFFCSIMLVALYTCLILSAHAIQEIRDLLIRRKIMKFNIYIYLNKFQLQLLKASLIIRKEGFYQLVFTTCYDVQFAIFLQFSNQSYDIDLMINNILAFLSQVLYLKLIGNKLKNNELVHGRWQSVYFQVKLISALIFAFAIVSLQTFPQTQILIISSVSLLVSIYLFMVQPFKNFLTNYQLIIQEMSLFLASLTFVPYIYFPKSVDPIVLGWFNIMTLISMLVGSLVLDLYQFVINIKGIYCK